MKDSYTANMSIHVSQLEKWLPNAYMYASVSAFSLTYLLQNIVVSSTSVHGQSTISQTSVRHNSRGPTSYTKRKDSSSYPPRQCHHEPAVGMLVYQ